MSHSGHGPVDRFLHRWKFNGTFEEAISDTQGIIAGVRESSGNHPTGVSIRWDMRDGFMWDCQLEYDCLRRPEEVKA